MPDHSQNSENLQKIMKEQEFLQAAAAYEAAQDALGAAREKLTAACTAIGVGNYVQGPDGVVHKVVVPKGTFMYYYNIGYVRTKRLDNEIATLSAKEAKAAGFDV